MPICSYLVIPDDGATDRVLGRLAEIPECDAVRAENRDVVILVTDTPGLEEEHALRTRVEALEEIRALLLTFGEIDPRSDVADPSVVGRPERTRTASAAGDAPRGSDARDAPSGIGR